MPLASWQTGLEYSFVGCSSLQRWSSSSSSDVRSSTTWCACGTRVSSRAGLMGKTMIAISSQEIRKLLLLQQPRWLRAMARQDGASWKLRSRTPATISLSPRPHLLLPAPRPRPLGCSPRSTMVIIWPTPLTTGWTSTWCSSSPVGVSPGCITDLPFIFFIAWINVFLGFVAGMMLWETNVSLTNRVCIYSNRHWRKYNPSLSNIDVTLAQAINKNIYI